MERLYGNEVNRLYVESFRENYRKERAAIAVLKTKKQAWDYINKIREKVRSCFQFPKEKCPLAPVVTGTVSNDICTMEKLYFFSRPNYPVTADFLLPKKRQGKVPAVLIVCGHSDIGKASEVYQSVAQGLVKKGFAVLIIDPIGQGERVSLSGKGFREFPWFDCCQEHNCEGKQLLLSGEWLGAWRTWDGVRAVDYLLTRPEVDSKWIGLTGNSGGGTLTTWINAVEDRLCMAAPSCYITTWKDNVENELPADIEQMPFNAAALGLEMSDFLLASAPRPLLMMGQMNDFFDHEGLIDTYHAVKHVYDLIEARTEYFVGPVNHGYSIHNRETMYAFFTELALGKASKKEGEIHVFSEPETYAAGGDIANIPENRTIREKSAELADLAIAQRKKLSSSALKQCLKTLIKPGETFVPGFRTVFPRFCKSKRIYSRFALETEPGEITSILKRKSDSIFYHFPATEKKLMLYIPHLDSQDELEKRTFPKKYEAVYGLDMRGIGELAPSGCDQPADDLPENRDFFAQYQSDYHYAALSFMLDKPMVGRRVHDILCAVELLAQNGAEVDVTASRLGCVPALMAAVLSDKIRHIHLEDGLDSYDSLIRVPATWWPYSVLVPDVLRYFDLHDLRNAIIDKII